MAYKLGIDTSKWSGKIIWLLVYESGLVFFVIPKASQGTLGEDTQWDNSKAGCIQYGFPFGGYHYFMPSLSAIEQARFFVQTVGAGVKVLVCDVESAILAQAQEILASSIVMGDESPSTVPDLRGKESYTPAEQEAIQKAILSVTGQEIVNSANSTQAITLAQMVKNFMEEVTRLRPDCTAVIYTSPGFWNANVAPNWIWEMPYDLWVAHWGVPAPTIPQKWTNWVLWQYTTTLRIPGIDSYEDGNRARDTLDLYEYFGNGNPVPPPPPTTNELLMECIQEGLRVRVAPNTSARVVRELEYGDILHVIEIHGNDAWAQIGEDEYANIKLSADRNMRAKP